MDQDCSGGSDYDQDGDGIESADYGGEDCDDLNPSVYPGAREFIGDGLDSDCDGSTEEVGETLNPVKVAPQSSTTLRRLAGLAASSSTIRLVRRRVFQ